MDSLDSVLTFAKYNQWINQRIFDAAERLSIDERKADQAAFFGSIHGTLNHVVIGDSIWLRRFLKADIPANELLAEEAQTWLPQPVRLDDMLFEEWSDLRDMRETIDAFLLEWTDAFSSADLDYELRYSNTQGRPFLRPLGSLLNHFFNHQTHHRGQVSTLLFQNGVDPGVTDLQAILPNMLGAE